MKLFYKVIFTFLFTNSLIYPQPYTELSLDLLRTPSSPAFQILDVGVTKIERPYSPTDFMVSVNQASDNFTTIPLNYAIDISPFWLVKGETITYDNSLLIVL